MKAPKNIAWYFLLLVVIAALYRIIPGRPFGFAPQWAMAVFAGAVIKDRKWAFIMPVLSMFVSDLIYQLLYMRGLSDMPGFYGGQWQNYLLFTLLVFVGMAVKKLNIIQVGAASVAAPTLYFLLSNFLVWASNGLTRGLNRPKTFDGLIACYADGLPFYRMSIIATFIFSAILFGSYFLIKNLQTGNANLRKA